jgi:prepilin-type N-terminal cleavage/methylation domain-containing protein
MAVFTIRTLPKQRTMMQRRLAEQHGLTVARRAAFTLVELLVVVAIIGTLMSLLLAGVQVSREMARKASCSNNLRNQLLSLHEFVAAQQRLPAGREYSPVREYSWCVEVLPHLEQGALYQRYDRNKPWNDPAVNKEIAERNLRIFRCAAAIKKFPGKTDYGGIMGSTITVSPGFDFTNGVMIEVGRKRRNYLVPAEIVDGMSQTLALAECADREADAGGLWVTGFNCFSHDNGTVNGPVSDDICSRHPHGAFVGFVDGKVHFLSQNTDGYVIGALCTRNGGEIVSGY